MNLPDSNSLHNQVKQIKFHQHQAAKWLRWSEQLWGKAEPGWLERDGQDHFYREKVVLPALLRALDSLPQQPRSVIDLGCGDGHSSSLLVTEFERRGLSLSVILVDRSTKLLKAAGQDPRLGSSELVHANLVSQTWWKELPQLPHPSVFLAVFMLQELPDLSPLLNGVSRLMSSGDVLLAVVPAPSYAEGLRKSSRVRVIEKGSSVDDWFWAGEYPISTPGGVLALPHFQRSLEDYGRAARSSGLRLITHENLNVPDTQTARSVFSETVYGCAIIGKPSSTLLTFSSAASKMF